MHICFISSASDPIFPERRGAITPFIWGISQELIRKGNTVSILGIGKGSINQNNFKIFTSSSNEFFSSLHKSMGSLPITPSKFLFDKFLLKEIIRLNTSSNIDILHINVPYSIANFAKPFLGIHSVCSIHNQIRLTFPLKFCDRLLPVSKYLQRSLLEKNVDNKKINVVPVAIDPSLYKSRKSKDDLKKELNLENYKVLLFVGRKCPEKGPQVLIKALSKIIQYHPNTLAIFIGPDYFFGSTASIYTDSLIALASSLHLDKHVLFLNFISDEELLSFYDAADIVVCPSIWQEPLGKVVIEALAFEKPVVASNVGGIPEIIMNGINGMLVPPNSSFALANAVIYLFNNENFSSELGRNGRKSIERDYSFKPISERCLEIYESVLK